MQFLRNLIYVIYFLISLSMLILFVYFNAKSPNWDMAKLTTLVVFIYTNHEAKFLKLEDEINE